MSEQRPNWADRPPLAFPTPQSQEMVLVARTEIAALKRGVSRALRDPLASMAPWAFTWLGVGIGALVSFLAINAVAHQQLRPWIVAAHVALMFIGFFLAAFCGWAARTQRGARLACERELHEELASIRQ